MSRSVHCLSNQTSHFYGNEEVEMGKEKRKKLSWFSYGRNSNSSTLMTLAGMEGSGCSSTSEPNHLARPGGLGPPCCWEPFVRCGPWLCDCGPEMPGCTGDEKGPFNQRSEGEKKTNVYWSKDINVKSIHVKTICSSNQNLRQWNGSYSTCTFRMVIFDFHSLGLCWSCCCITANCIWVFALGGRSVCPVALIGYSCCPSRAGGKPWSWARSTWVGNIPGV